MGFPWLSMVLAASATYFASPYIQSNVEVFLKEGHIDWIRLGKIALTIREHLPFVVAVTRLNEFLKNGGLYEVNDTEMKIDVEKVAKFVNDRQFRASVLKYGISMDMASIHDPPWLEDFLHQERSYLTDSQ